MQTPPVMCDRKLIVVKNCGIFENSTSKDFKELVSELSDLPEYLCVVFTELDFNKKKEKNLEIFNKNGAIVKFDFLPQGQFELWLEKLFEAQNKQILIRDLKTIASRCSYSMASAFNEYNKLISYAGEKTKITENDVDLVVSKTTESRIFDIIDNIALGKTTKTIEEINTLEAIGENPSTVMSLIASRISELLMLKHLMADRLNAKEIAEYFEPKRPPFVIQKLTEQSRRFDEKHLRHMALKGLKYTADVRSGSLDKWNAVYMYVSEFINK